jgi:Neuralized
VNYFASGLTEFSIMVLDVDTTSNQGLAFGMTSCDPCELSALSESNADLLPADPDALMDRQEYWVVTKNILSGATACNEGDVLTFQLVENGKFRKISRKRCCGIRYSESETVRRFIQAVILCLM